MVITKVVLRLDFIQNKVLNEISCRLSIRLPGKLLISNFLTNRINMKYDLKNIIKQKLDDYDYLLVDEDFSDYQIIYKLVKNKVCVLEFPGI